MSERDMRGRVVKALRELDAIPVENPVLPGTPDVNYIEGWIELKWLRRWPSRIETRIRIKHFSAEQRIRHLQRRRAGGQSWFLLQCRREWLLLDGAVAALNVGLCTRAGLAALAVAHWEDGIKEEELKKCLSLHKQNVYSLTGDDEERLKKLLRNDMASHSVST
jgi:hypothetical protein